MPFPIEILQHLLIRELREALPARYLSESVERQI